MQGVRMDKYEKRARARRIARQRQLRRRLMLTCIIIAAAAIGISLAASKLSRAGSLKTASASAMQGNISGTVQGNGTVEVQGSADAENPAAGTADSAASAQAGTAADGSVQDGASASAQAGTSADGSALNGASASAQTGTSASADVSAVLSDPAVAPEDLTASVPDILAPTEVSDEEAASLAQAQKAAEEGDRASFAVDPANTVWNYNDNGVKTVYLTFDDGPSQYTSQVLDILDRYGAKATFFETAQNPEYFSLIKECYDRGHTIGLHTYCHEYPTVYASTDAYFSDLKQIADVVSAQIGYVPLFVRFPGGSSNEVSKHYCEGIMTELSQEVQARGYQYWDWNASSGDGADETADQTVANATQYSFTNIVLLMHDAVGKQSSIDALPRIIEYYQSQGYVFKALTRTSMVVHHEIFN